MDRCSKGIKAEEKQQIDHYLEIYKHRLFLLVLAVRDEGGTFLRQDIEGKVPKTLMPTLKFSSTSTTEIVMIKKPQYNGFFRNYIISLIFILLNFTASPFAPSAFGLGNDDFKTHFTEDSPDEVLPFYYLFYHKHC